MIYHLLEIIAIAAVIYRVQNILSLIILHLFKQLVRKFIIQLIKNPLLILLLQLHLVSGFDVNLGITGYTPTASSFSQFVNVVLLWLGLVVEPSDLDIVLNNVAALR
jgi:hypothetical protein